MLVAIALESARILRARQAKSASISWNCFNKTRLTLLLLLLAIKITELVLHLVVLVESYNKNDREYVVLSALQAPTVQVLCYLCLGVIYIQQRKVGIFTSGPIWIYLSAAICCECIEFYMALADLRSLLAPELELVVKLAHSPVLALLFILECRGDTANSEERADTSRPESPERYASFCSSVVFWWFNSFLWFGYRTKIEIGNLWATLRRDEASRLVPSFTQAWAEGKPSPKKLRYQLATGETRQHNHVLKVLFSLYWPRLILAVILKLIHDLLQFATPILLKLVLEYMGTPAPLWHGLFYASMFLVIPTVQSIALGKYFYVMQVMGSQVRSMIMSAVYRKSLLLSGNSRIETTSGQIVNLMAVDSQRFQDLLMYINMIWSAPFQIIVTIILLYRELGWPVFAGVACLILLLPCNTFLASRVKAFQMRVMKTKDERIKQVNEILSGIKVLKLYAWENSFIASLFSYRNREIRFLTRIMTLDSVQSFIWQCSPFAVALITFAVYVTASPTNILDPSKAFVSISLFNILRAPLYLLPNLISTLVLTLVSAKRITRFLNSDELVNYVTRNEESEAISVEGGTVSWSNDQSDKENSKKEDSGNAVLKDIDFHVKRGSFVAVIGQVGSGKTSLLSSILGEMHRISGRFNIARDLKVAYVPQQAWIQNMTVKDNILFGSSMHQERYHQVLSVCSLESDLETLPGGDLAEIGEKGINLSGGQKQRVSLARACYSNSDVYLLDDPLSALDSHVARHIYDKVLSSTTGLLRQKTRVLATNNLFLLPHTDHIVVMKEGRIVESGTYNQLVKIPSGHMAEFMRQYSNNLTSADEERAEEVEVGKSPENELVALTETSKSPGSKPDVGKLIEVEKLETGSVGYRIYLSYFRAASFFWLFVVFISSVASASFNIASNWWLSVWSSDKPTADIKHDEQLRTLRLTVYAALGGFQALTVLSGAIGLCWGSLRASKILHANLLDRIMHSPMAFFDTTPNGRIVNRFSKDIDVVDSTLPNAYRSWLNCLLQVISTMLVICFSFPSFIVILVPMFVIYILVQRIFIITTRQLKRLESNTRSPIFSHFNETLSGAGSIRAYQCSERFVTTSDNLIDINQSCGYTNVIANRWLTIQLEFFGNLITTATVLFSVYHKGSISPGVVGLTISYSMSITQTLSWFVRMTSDLETNIVSVERIVEYLQNKQEDLWVKPCRPPTSWPENGSIEIENYSTKYRNDTELVLSEVSLAIKPCEKVGVVGRTGSGKSSLSLSLFRILEPASGCIRIDGLDIAQFGLHDIRSRLTIIPQDPVLFSGSLRFNLDPLHLHSDLDIWRALELAHLKRHMETLKDGLEHTVGEFGENFSVGQRQLICLARAILRKSKILVLDEATASVDIDTDSIVQRTIRDIFHDCTIITIAHRLHTILDSDRILVLDKGRVKELDTPARLVADSNTAFAKLLSDADIDPSSFNLN